MNSLKFKTTVMLLSFSAFVISISTSADQLPDGVKQILTSVKGNITYYVKSGDKVKQGDPLFYVGTADNNAAIFFQILHKIDFYNKLYLRRKELVKTHAVSQEEYDNAMNSLVLAKDELASFICKFKQGFYVAPFNCEVVDLMFVNGSGIKDGFAAISIRSADKDYKFDPKVPNNKFLELINSSNELTKTQAEKIDVNEVVKILKKVQ